MDQDFQHYFNVIALSRKYYKYHLLLFKNKIEVCDIINLRINQSPI